jgi:hypothetical protein
MPPKAKKLKTEDLDLDVKAENLTLNSPKISRAPLSSTKLDASSAILAENSKSKTQSQLTKFIKSDKPIAKKLKIEDSNLDLKEESLDSPKTSRVQSPAKKSEASSSLTNDSISKIQSPLTSFIKSDKEKTMNTLKLIESIAQKRSSSFTSVLDFKFNKKRVRVLTPIDNMSENCNGVLYWMTREQRVQGKFQYECKRNFN